MTKQTSILLHSPSECYSGQALQAAEAIRKRNHAVLSAILNQSAEVASNRGTKNLPLLAWAMGHNDPASFKLLLDAGANPDDFIMVEGAKVSLLSVATGSASSEWMDLLLAYRANPNGIEGTEPPLFTARYAHKPDRFERLLKAGADVNYPDRTGKTIIVVAVLADDYQKALELVKRGANPYVRMKNGTTIANIIERYPLPPDTAEGRAQAELAHLLK